MLAAAGMVDEITVSDEPVRQLEQLVEREMRVLDALPPLSPAPETVGRVKAAVVAEAARLNRRWRAHRWMRELSAVAAALLMVAALNWSLRGGTPSGSTSDPAQELSAWASAVEDSRAAVAALYSDNVPVRRETSEKADRDDLFERLEEWLVTGA